MAYLFLDYRPAGDGQGYEPDCPPDTPFLLLADIRGLGWGIFDIDIESEWPTGKAVSDDLACLIESARRYPPALGLARQEVGQVFGEHHPSQEEFSRAYGTALATHLARQHEVPYILAPALREEVGYLAKGEWYWVLQISGSPGVASWVSADFYIYKNDMNDFDFTGQQLKALGYVG
jgi:hypothetical protein